MATKLDDFMQANAATVKVVPCPHCGNGYTVTGLAEGTFTQLNTAGKEVERVQRFALTQSLHVARVRDVGVSMPSVAWFEVTKIDPVVAAAAAAGAVAK